jgi:hypothetical protein
VGRVGELDPFAEEAMATAPAHDMRGRCVDKTGRALDRAEENFRRITFGDQCR